MANLKITQLPTATDADGTELMEVVQSGINKQSTINNAVRKKIDAKLTLVTNNGSYTPVSGDLTSINLGQSSVFVGNDTGDFTVPANATIAFGTGTQFGVRGYANVIAAGGVTITGTRGDLTIPSGMTVVLEKTATNTWILHNGSAGGGGGGTWGSITGTLSDQTDLQTELDANATAISNHIGDTTAAHAASAISFTPTGTVGSTDVQAAIAEVAAEAISSNTLELGNGGSRPTATYTLVIGDAGKIIETDVASAHNLTVPLNSSVAFPIRTVVYFGQYGAGQMTINPTGGVTLRSVDGRLKCFKQYSQGYMVKINTDEWWVHGDLTL